MKKQPVLDGLTKAELMELLKDVPDDGILAFPQPTHDHWHNVIAKTLHMNDVEQVDVVWSDYHEEWKIDEGEYTDDGMPTQTVWLLS